MGFNSAFKGLSPLFGRDFTRLAFIHYPERLGSLWFDSTSM